MASRWTHSICDACWEKLNPGRKPLKVMIAGDEAEQTCCFCQVEHRSDIYVRADPEKLACKGEHA